MDWYIHHVNTPAVNVKGVAAFLQATTGMVHGSKWLYPESVGELSHNEDTIAFFGEECRGLHVCKPLPLFARDNNFLHNPTIGGHVAFNVNDIDGMKIRLEKAGVAFTDAGMFAIAGVVQIYFFDPSMNLIEVNQIVDPVGGTGPRPGERHDIHREKGDWYIHHVCLSVHDLAQSAAFFRDVVGLGECRELARHDDDGLRRPRLTVFGTENRGLHLVKPDPEIGRNQGFRHNPTVGGHYAITVPEITRAKSALDQAGIAYTVAKNFEFSNVEQIFAFDPEDWLVEINQTAMT